MSAASFIDRDIGLTTFAIPPRCTGARQIATGLSELRRRNGKVGIVLHFPERSLTISCLVFGDLHVHRHWDGCGELDLQRVKFSVIGIILGVILVILVDFLLRVFVALPYLGIALLPISLLARSNVAWLREKKEQSCPAYYKNVAIFDCHCHDPLNPFPPPDLASHLTATQHPPCPFRPISSA